MPTLTMVLHQRAQGGTVRERVASELQLDPGRAGRGHTTFDIIGYRWVVSQSPTRLIPPLRSAMRAIKGGGVVVSRRDLQGFAQSVEAQVEEGFRTDRP